jgi:Cu(I)/Ag(I) efflux system membrane fusion protein
VEETEVKPIANGARAILGALALAGLVALAGVVLVQQPGAQDGYTWEPATAEVAMGDAVRVAVRLIGPSGLVRLDAGAVSAARIDMGPDGMAMMYSALRPVPAAQDESLAFETDLIMAGRWALSITALPEGQTAPVSGEVIFTAVEADADAAALDDAQCEILYYRNPMGLADVSPTPKKDSMGMDYIPVCADEVGGAEGTVRVDAERLQRAGVRTEPVGYRRLNRAILGAAEVIAGEDRIAYVSAKFSGFVDSQDLPVTGDFLTAGRPIARVWIEDANLLQRQADYIISLARGGAEAERAEQNLRLFDLPDNAIASIRETGAAVRLIELTAPISGIVTRRTAVFGMRFNAGDMLFELVDLSRVWVMVRVPEQDVDLLREGQTTTLRFFGLPDPVESRIQRVYPTLDPGTRSGTVRIVLENPAGRFRIGMYAEAQIAVALTAGHVMAVPVSAVIDDGTRQVVFVVVDKGVLEPRDVVLGARGEAYVEIRSGVSEGENVVVAGNFLIDAESNLQAALAAFAQSGDGM